MYKYTKIILVSLVVFSFAFGVSAVTKPSPDANMEDFSYVFYLYYDNGRLFADRDYEIKYDILSEKFVESSAVSNPFKVEIVNFKSSVAVTAQFDPSQGRAGFTAGKIQVRAPYVADGQRAVFYDDKGQQLVTVFVIDGALCDDDGICNSASGENQKTCSNDCKVARTPVATVGPTTPIEEELDMMTLVTYGAGGLGIVVLGWFGWRWWKKKKEESFLPPPSAPSSPSGSVPPFPPVN